jgi:type I restriction-modification system DNA methylase subunit/signal transduction histidine kinase
MDKVKDNKTEKLQEEIYKAFDLLRGPLQTPEAFKIIFVLLHYKRFEKGYETYTKATYSGEGVGIHNDERAVRLYEQIYEALTNISAEAFGLQFTKISPDNAIIPELGDEQECVTKESIKETSSLNITQDVIARLTQIPQITRSKVLEILNSNDLSFKDVSSKNFELVLSMLENKCMERVKGWNYVNPSLSKLIVKLLNPHSGLHLNFPFCGLGQMLIAAVDHVCEVSKPGLDSAFTDKGGKHDFFIGLNSGIELHDKNMETLSLAKLRVLAKVYNSYETGADEDVGEFYVNDIDHNSKADVIFLNPPFALRHPEHLPSKVDIDGNSLEIPRNNGELFELLNHVQKLSENGRMGVVIPSGVLFMGGGVRDIRKFLTERDYLDAVIQLPQRMFSQTSIVTAILIINKNKPRARKHKTLFAEVESSLEGKTVFISDDEIDRIVNTYNKAKGDIDAVVTLEEIQRQDYNLSPDKYIGALSNEIKELVETHAGTHLGELCDVSRGRSRKPDPDYNNGLPFITTKDLAKDVIDPYLNYDKCFLGVPQTHGSVFNKKCILISLVGNTLKPTIFDPETAYKGEPDQNGQYHDKHPGVILGHNIVSIIPNEQIVDFEYMYYQLYNPMVKKQIETLLIGAGGIPRIALQNFAKIVIPVLESIEDQRRSISERKLSLLELENAKLEAFKERLKVGDRKREAEFEMVGRLEHNISPRLSGAKTCIELSIELIKQESLSKEAINVDATEKELAINKLGIAFKELNIITDILDRARKDVLHNVEEKRLNFQEVDICKIFEEDIIPLYKNIIGFEEIGIVVNCNEVENIKLDKTAFMEAINNIIKNACDWGFKGSKNVNAELVFDIGEDDDFIIIDYKNNGKMFPKEIDKEQFLKQRGHGGKTVNDFLQVHDAEFEIVRCSNCNFIIKIPRRAYK